MTISADTQFELGELMAELRAYLIAVDAFRAEGREPVWLGEERGVGGSCPGDGGSHSPAQGAP